MARSLEGCLLGGFTLYTRKKDIAYKNHGRTLEFRLPLSDSLWLFSQFFYNKSYIILGKKQWSQNRTLLHECYAPPPPSSVQHTSNYGPSTRNSGFYLHGGLHFRISAKVIELIIFFFEKIVTLAVKHRFRSLVNSFQDIIVVTQK